MIRRLSTPFAKSGDFGSGKNVLPEPFHIGERNTAIVTTEQRIEFNGEELLVISTVPGAKPVLMTLGFKQSFAESYETSTEEQSMLIEVYEDYLLSMEHTPERTLPGIYHAPSFSGDFKVYEEEHVVIFCLPHELGDKLSHTASVDGVGFAA